MPSDQSQITKPVETNAQLQTPVRVFSMPERYRHGAMANVVEPQKISATVATAPAAPSVPASTTPTRSTVPVVGKKKISSSTRAIILSGVVILIALIVAGFILIRSQNVSAPASTPVVQTPVVTPTPQPTPTPVTSAPPSTIPTPPVTSPFPTAITPGKDTDSDGLTDVEETIVYGTNPQLPDTDGDGFLDRKLLGAGTVTLFTPDHFQMTYPTKWTMSSSNSGGYAILTTTGETFTVTSTAKDVTMSLPDWYNAQIKGEALVLSKTIKAYPFLMAANNLTAYVDLGDSVVTLTYDTGTKSTIDYLQTFQMMINSIAKK